MIYYEKDMVIVFIGVGGNGKMVVFVMLKMQLQWLRIYSRKRNLDILLCYLF